MTMHVKVTAVSNRQASTMFVQEGTRRLALHFPDIQWEVDDDNPEIVFFLSGGSEQTAIARLRPDRLTLLLAGFHDNAYAAALEVKAWAGSRDVPVALVSLQEAMDGSLLKHFAMVCEGFRTLQGKRAGLIGDVSHWLVASALSEQLARERLGIIVEHLPWKELPDYRRFLPDPEFMEVYRNHPAGNLEKEAGIYSFLKQLLHDHRLDALTLECFEMVNAHDMTACLALALLNSKGTAAGCEGDLVSLAGMMLVQALTGQIPWMANVAGIFDDRVLFAHCTAPLDVLGGYRLNTHFETGKSAAIEGKLAMEQVTVFRLSEKLNKAFVAPGSIVSQPSHDFACRTQTEISLTTQDIEKLRQEPLGNHHLILPGNKVTLLRMACQYKQMLC